MTLLVSQIFIVLLEFKLQYSYICCCVVDTPAVENLKWMVVLLFQTFSTSLEALSFQKYSNSIVVLDKASIHHCQEVAALIASVGALE